MFLTQYSTDVNVLDAPNQVHPKCDSFWPRFTTHELDLSWFMVDKGCALYACRPVMGIALAPGGMRQPARAMCVCSESTMSAEMGAAAHSMESAWTPINGNSNVGKRSVCMLSSHTHTNKYRSENTSKVAWLVLLPGTKQVTGLQVTELWLLFSMNRLSRAYHIFGFGTRVICE